MKKLISVLLTLAMIFGVMFAMGVPGYAETSGDYTYTVSNGEATITAYSGTETDVVIPAELDGYPVKTIATQAFRYNKTIVSIYISDNVTTIESYAFRDCTALQSVRLPETLTKLNTYTFYGCKVLDNLIIPESVTSIENYAIGNCAAMKTCTIMGANTEVKSNAFYLTKLDTVYLHEGSTADGFSFPNNPTKIYLEDVLPHVNVSNSQVKFKATGASTVEDAFQIRITSVITDEDWQFNFANTVDDTATTNTIQYFGLVAYYGAPENFDADTAKAVVTNTFRDSNYTYATTDYIKKVGNDDAYFGAIVNVSHSTLANDVIFMGFVNYIDANGTVRNVFYPTSVTAAVTSNYDSIVSSYLSLYPYAG